MWHVRGERNMHTKLRRGNTKERGYLDELILDGNVIIKRI